MKFKVSILLTLLICIISVPQIANAESEAILTKSKTVSELLAGIPSDLPQNQNNWEIYKNINQLEKSHQEQGIYNIEDISNPLHHAKTGDPFSYSVKEWLYNNGFIKNVYNSNDWVWTPVEKPDGTGFAYVDKYGYTHVDNNLVYAITYSKDGRIYDFDSTKYKGGYALSDIKDLEGDYGRSYLSSLEGSKPFGNESTGDSTSNRKFDLFNIKDLLKR